MIENEYRYVVAIREKYCNERTVCALPYFVDLRSEDVLLVGQEQKRYVCDSAPCFVDKDTYNMLRDVLHRGYDLPKAVAREIVTIERFDREEPRDSTKGG